MQQSHIDSGSSDSQYQYQQNKDVITNQFVVSILRHLPEARKIMEGHSYEHYTIKCMYEQPLTNNPAFIMAKIANTQNAQLPNNRLVKLEDALFEHQSMKDKIKSMLNNGHKKQLDNNTTLWNTYSYLTPSYSRFGATAKKNNFANVLMPINGVNIVLPSKYADRVHDADKKVLPLSPDTIRFDSHFESGNLLYAYRKQSFDIQTYDLILQNDVNTKGHNQWFYFKVYNTKQHNRIRFNIVNFIKDQSMFSYGIKPLIFSQRDFSRHRLGWVRDGDKVCYYENNYRRQCNGNSYFTLTFQYYFRQVDTIYFAPTHPYTYSQLTEFYDNLIAEHSLSNFISIKTVAQTVGRNSVTVITIGTGRRQIKDCSVVWVLGRQHPGETTSSYMAEGVINYLLSIYSPASVAKNQYLDGLIFKIVPMLNVDGVIHGNTRAELTGVDPNRMWKKTMKRLSPGVSAIKKLIAENKQQIKLVLDLHSHSKKLGCFFYGNSMMHDPKKLKIYPALVCQNDQRFDLKNCRFRGGYQTTARSVLFNQLAIKQVYTVECSLLGYMRKNRITQYKVTDYYEMGKKLIQSFIKLEKQKIIKNENQIIEEMNDAIFDGEGADSARSQSSLSDQQYEQIKHKVKVIKKKRVKKSENQNPPLLTAQNVNPQPDPSKYYYKRNSRNNTRVQLSLNEKKRKCFKMADELRVKNQNMLETRNKSIGVKRQGTIGINDSVARVQMKNKINKQNQNEERKTKNNSFLVKMKMQPINFNAHQNRITQYKQVQVQANIGPIRDQNKRYGSKPKGEKTLCVVGSSLEDDLVYVCKNQVGTQAIQQVVEQCTSNANAQANRKSMKIKKIPKLLNYLCSNLIGVTSDNSVLPQDRRLAPLLTKKYLNNPKN